MSPRTMALSMRLGSRLSTETPRKMVIMKFAVCALLGSFVSVAQTPAPPSGAGRAEMEKMCTGCHELARSMAPRQDRDGWIQTMMKMRAYGMKSTDKEFATVLNYLSTNYPAPPIPPVNINTARAIELEARFSLLRSEAARLDRLARQERAIQIVVRPEKVPTSISRRSSRTRARSSFERLIQCTSSTLSGTATVIP